MKQKRLAIIVMALAVFVVAACSPTTAEVEPEAAVVVAQDDVEAVAAAPTVAEVAEEPPTPAPIPTDTAAPAPTDEPEAVAETTGETEEVAEDAAEEMAEEDPEEPDDAMAAESAPVQFGRTEEGAFFYGSPTAGITLIDHSDFL